MLGVTARAFHLVLSYVKGDNLENVSFQKLHNAVTFLARGHSVCYESHV
jgi:hypothetical protein